MHTTISTHDLERALRDALPPEHQGRAGELARTLATVARGEPVTKIDPALRPVLRALAGAEVTVGSALVSFGGAQTGDITIGDIAGRDVIKVSIAAPPSQLTPQERRNRQAMIQKVRAIWVEGLLRHSLAEVVRIELGITERPDAVQMPLNPSTRSSTGHPATCRWAPG